MNGAGVGFALTPGEFLGACGFLITIGTVVWKSGKTAGILDAMRADLSTLVTSDRATRAVLNESATDRAGLHIRVAEVERRVGDVEELCIATHRKGPGI